MLKIILGYVLSFAYMGLVILLGESLQRKFDLNKEMVRKYEHLATAMSWIICYFFVGVSIHLLIINVMACIALGVIAFGGLMKSVERTDTAKSYGLFYFGLSTAIVAGIVVFVNADFYPLNGIAWFCLAFGDGFAPIFAKALKKYNTEVMPTKSIMGMLAVFLFSALSVIVFNYAFSLGYSWLFMMSLACLSCLAELFGKRGIDNFFVEFGVFGYLVMQYYGLVSTALSVAIIISLVVVVVSAKAKALSPSANAVSFVFLLICTFCGDWALMSMVLSLYVLAAITSKLTSKKYNEITNSKKIKSQRDAWQILANSVVAGIFAVLFYAYAKPIFLLCAIVAIGEEFADSMASDFGRLSKRQPVDLLRFKRMQTGISGGISLFGTAMALIGALIAVAIPYAFLTHEISWQLAVLVCGVAFFGTFIDSAIGSGLQILYKCSVCEKLVESKTHCEEQAIYVKGISFVNNTVVNFISGVITSLILLGLYFLIGI